MEEVMEAEVSEGSQAPEVVEESQDQVQEPTQQDQVEEVSQEATKQSEEVAPEWAPNYSYKYEDEDFEVEEQYRQHIKDAETERIIKEWSQLNKAAPMWKEKVAGLEEKAGLADELAPMRSLMEEAAKAYEAKDMDTFFNKIGVPYETIESYVAEKLRYQQLPEDERRAYDEKRQQTSEMGTLREQVTRLEQEKYLSDVQRLDFELDRELGGNEVKNISDVYDEIYGSGAFRTEVIQAGKALHSMYGKDFPPGQVIKMVSEKLQPMVGRLSGQVEAARPEPKIIKNVKGTTASPGKSKPKSIADLRKAAAEL